MKLKLNAPKQVTFIVAVVLAVLGLLGFLIDIPVLSNLDIWLVLVGFILLALGNLLEGL
ncbi:MAG TPA: hypothetical protein PLJ78_14505 [Anaerolineae bacterium]|nr:hypothetical protein [Anaerolineae bacterium]HQK15143.1 hypothetical protein [Anaerolineae bacterium]